MTQKEYYISKVRQEIGPPYSHMKWLSEADALIENDRRTKLLEALRGRVHFSFLQNKIHYGPLSRGCACCGAMRWSCLFLLRRCPAKCFFCPVSTSDRLKRSALPCTYNTSFSSPKDYIDYLSRFRFTGVGISGGDPFADFRMLLAYIRSIRRAFGKRIYLWVYTSGIFVDTRKLHALKDEGLDEIRINIAATGYDMRAVRLARRSIDTVTVEIPSIPEDYDRLITVIHKMENLGVSHLNLHELTTSRSRYKEFMRRQYTFLHHPLIPVLESGMTALRVMQYAVEKKLNIPINYCSSEYKSRFHFASLMRGLAAVVVRPHEGITDRGFIRSFSLQDHAATTRRAVAHFQRNGVDGSLWNWDADAGKLLIHHSLLDALDIIGGSPRVFLSYRAITLLDEAGTKSPCERILINRRTSMDTKSSVVDIDEPLTVREARYFRTMFLEKKNNQEEKGNVRQRRALRKLTEFFAPYERIPEGFGKLY